MEIRNPLIREEYKARRAKVIRLWGAITMDPAPNYPQISLVENPTELSLVEISRGVAALLTEDAFDMARWSRRKGLPMSEAEETFLDNIAPERFTRLGQNRANIEAIYQKSPTAWLEYFKNR